MSAEERARVRAAVGSRIRELREERGLSQRQLGERVGMERTDISRAENGKLSLGQERLARIAKALKAASDEFERIRLEAERQVLEERGPLAAVLPLAERRAEIDDRLERLAVGVSRLERGQTEILASIENAREQVLAALQPPPAQPRRGLHE